MTNKPVLSDEEEKLALELHKLDLYPKLRKWLELFLDKSNKLTYGNRTQSALEAYNLDPITQYFSAGKIGQENYKKLSNLAALYYEQEGMHTSNVLELIASHAVAGKPKALEMLADLTGVYASKPQILVQNNVQVNNGLQLPKEEAEELAAEFTEFIQSKNKPQPVPNPETSHEVSGG